MQFLNKSVFLNLKMKRLRGFTKQLNPPKKPFMNINKIVWSPYSAGTGQILFSQINFGEDKDGPLPLRVHLAHQVCYNAPLCIHTAIWVKGTNPREEKEKKV